MSRLERHLVISVLVLFAVPAAVGTMLLVVAYRAGAFDRSPSAMLTAIVVGLFVVLAYAAVAAHGIGRSFVRNVEIIRHGTELMTTVNPDYRLGVRTGDELEVLAGDINRLADQLREARLILPSPGIEDPARQPRPELHDLVDLEVMTSQGVGEERDRRLSDLTFVVLDVETTGLRPDLGDRVVSLAAVKIRGGVICRDEVFDALVNPGRSIPPPSAAIHGITDERVAGAPRLEAVLSDFLRFAEGGVLVGHEVWFDLAFLEPEARRMGWPDIPAGHGVVDTRLISRFIHGSLPDHTLDTVAERLGVTIEDRHTALGDALATAEVLIRLLVLLRQRGITTLPALLDAVRTLRSSRGRA
jgi:DNA polymerase III epsilon subunit family exonuclease